MIPVWERQKTFEISEPSHVAEVRRFTNQLAKDAGFYESQAGGVALVTTELATNLLKHASRGEIVVRPIVERGIAGVELLALDQGSGIANLAESLRDGYSTAGSPGTGLGAIARLAAEFDIQTQPGKGTAVMARLWGGKIAGESEDHIAVGAICKPMRGETRCGDGWGCELLADRCILVVVDGLGHGTGAAAAAPAPWPRPDPQTTRHNSSHSQISYTIFCMKKKKMPIVEYDCTHSQQRPIYNLRLRSLI